VSSLAFIILQKGQSSSKSSWTWLYFCADWAFAAALASKAALSGSAGASEALEGFCCREGGDVQCHMSKGNAN
jgi:hypothetical protein